MPPKPQKPKAPAGYKAAALVKDVLPPSVKNPPREGRSIKVPDAAALQANIVNAQQLNAPIFEEFQKIEEWPGDEAARTFDFGIESSTSFIDQTCNPFRLLPSFTNDKTNLIFWRRPNEFIQTEHEEISAVKNKIQIKRRTSQLINPIDRPNDMFRRSKHDDFISSPSRNLGMTEDTKLQIKIFETYEREETAQEAEIRKKEQAEKAEKDKKAKKPGKKEDPVEDKPDTIKDIKLSSIDMSYVYPTDSKWIASQLQLIKDRNIGDCFTNKPIWTKIYPQVEGVPVVNKSGRYWVKLYYMGKQRKIEIDDRMPVNFKGQCKFPRSVKKEEIWTCIFSKAIFKLIQMTQDIGSLQNLCGSGIVIYSLTGMLSQTIPMHLQSKGTASEWQNKLAFLREMLSDQHYQNQDILMTCYCDPEYKPIIERKNTIESQKNSKDFSVISHPQDGIEEIKEETPTHENDRASFQTPVESPAVNPPNQLQGKQQGQQGQDQDNSQMRQPIPRAAKRNMTVGGLARSSTQIFDQISNNIHLDNLANGKIEEDEEQPSSQNNSNNNLSQLSPTRRNNNPILASIQKAQNFLTPKKKDAPSEVITGFSYPITECFFNDNFNMVYVQKKTDKEIKLRQDYIEHSNLQTNKMNKEDKIEYRRKKKEFKDRIAEDEKKRIELITKPPIQYKFFRLKTAAGRVPQVNIFCPFSSEEINIAKTCIANKLNKPPNYQEGAEMRDDNKSVMSSALKSGEDSFQMRPLDDFSMLNNVIEPMNRGQGGVWVLDTDLYDSFQYFQLFYNPSKYSNHETITVPQSIDSEITIGEDHEVLLVERNSERENQDEKVMLLFGFMDKESKSAKIIPQPYCILQKFDFGQFNAIHEFPPLRGNQSSQLTEIENSNQVFKLMVYTPVSFAISISCTNTFRTMSILSYLTEYESYITKNFTIEYQALEEKKYHVLFRFRIPPQEFESVFLMKVKSSTDNNMLKYMRLKLVEEDTEGLGVMLNTIEGVEKNLYESSFTLSNYLRISIREKTNYYLVLEGEPPYSIAEGALNVDFYTKNNELTFENLEHVEPLQYFDRYFPTKYGIIFREKIYVSDQTIASFSLKIMDMIGAAGGAAQGSVDPKKKGGKPQGAESADLQEKEIIAKRLMKLELFENGKSIIFNSGHNSTLLSNVILKSTKSEEVKYLLEATFDLRDWPEAKTVNEMTENIHWFLKVVSTETVGVVRDTDKEDREKAIKKSWEDGEAGRSEKAKIARRKFIIAEKSQNGEKLTEEEAALLNEPRLTKKQREEAQAANAGGKKQAKKEDKKPAAAGKLGVVKGKEEVVEEKKEARSLPLSKDHRTNEIKAFLEHMEQERVREHLAEHPGQINVRSEENKEQLKKDSEKAKEEVLAQLLKNGQLREDLKQYQVDKLKTNQTTFSNERVEFKDDWTKYLQTREEVKGKMGAKTLKEREIIEIIKQEKPTIGLPELEKFITDCSAIPDFSSQLLETAKKLVKNLRISQMGDKMNESLSTFNIETLTNLMDDYTKYQVTGIDAELIKKVEDMLAESKDNPNFTIEKLAEQKKSGKKGKK